MRRIVLSATLLLCGSVLFAQTYWSSHTDATRIITDKAVARLSFPMEFKLFDLNKLVSSTQELKDITSTKKLRGKESAMDVVNSLLQKTIEQREVAERFCAQIQSMLPSPDIELLQERIGKAINWFVKSLYEQLIVPIHNHTASLQGKSGTRLLTNALIETEAVYWNKLNLLQSSRFPEFSFEGIEIKYYKERLETVSIKRKGKPIKGSSQLESLELFKSGNPIEKIAEQRGLAISTVQGHLAQFVLSGELEPQQLIAQEIIDAVLSALNNAGSDDNSAIIKDRLGENFSYADIRIVQNYRGRLGQVNQPS